ncbi:tetratricopeptide repeat protein [Clostridium fungisolvens]|uniref:tetratricopeptide repeat protein n=1 Tax=Clostridium fungisolvens TaxID=1604897 RepID=UPI0016128195|nr:hypothetical protein [Clostridium fungisolvens]
MVYILKNSIAAILIVIAGIAIRLLAHRLDKKLSSVIRRKKVAWLEKLKESGSYDEIANRYRKMASKQNKEYEKNNLMGLAALYEHDSETAIKYFQEANQFATGNYINMVEGNLAIAYLQNRWYHEALEMFDYQCENGSVAIFPYILALIMNDEEEEAKKFYKLNIKELKDTEKEFIDLILSFSPTKKDILEKVKSKSDDSRIWIYKPVIKDLIFKWNLIIFYNSTERQTILKEQGQKLLLDLKKQPQIFNSPEIKYMCSLISNVLPRISTYEGNSSLWGLIDNLDWFSFKLPLDEVMQEECNLFWSRIYYVFSRTSTADTYDFTKNQTFIKDQLPPDEKEVLDGSYRCSLFLSSTLHLVVRVLEIDEDGFKYFYSDIVDETTAEELLMDVKPVIKLIKEHPETEEILEPLLYRLVYNRNLVKEIDIINVLNRIPSNLHQILNPIKERRRGN